jgi:glycosyltransferase involved in cell wall biosynthesis
MEISIVIPAYRRPEDLKRCIKSCIKQTKKPEEIIITVRDFDEPCREVIREFQNKYKIVKMIILYKTGQMWAWYNGVINSIGDIVAFTDDDGEPFPDWLEHIENGFKDDKVGGIGGQVMNYRNSRE